MNAPETKVAAEPYLLESRDASGVVTLTLNRPQQFNGQFQIPTLDEVIALAKEQSSKTGRTIGIYPEVKHSTFHAALFGANRFEDKLVSTLHAAYGNTGKAPVFIQSFEVSNLQYLRTKTKIRLVQLIDANDVKIPINEAIGLDFPRILRAFLRQDPDIIR